MLKQATILGAAALLAGCVTEPATSLSVIPGQGKTEAEYSRDDAACRAGAVAVAATTTTPARPAVDYYQCMQSHGDLVVANRAVPYPAYGAYPYGYPAYGYGYPAYGYAPYGYGYGYPYAGPVFGLGLGIGFGGYYGGGRYYGGRGYYGGPGGYRGGVRPNGGSRPGTAGGIPIIRR